MCHGISIFSNYYLYTLSTVVNKSGCIENVQLHRVVWLLLSTSLRIYEVSFSIVHFLRIGVFFNQYPESESRSEGNAQSYSQSPYLDLAQLNIDSSTQWHRSQEINYNFSESKPIPLTNSPLAEESEDLNEQQIQICPKKDKPCELEIEQFSYTAQNLDTHLDLRNSNHKTQNLFSKST